ncbi:auxin-responsive protein IAA32-like [Diospyros lotus]|uniref:auxin-responsive protein IAA32-like n=1 Tax=Diospyros lotus TaxID=55363 RepID=UPI00224D194A|nr:auxin-responsive protein IAA32-like [Diospyros lotus]
MDSNTSGYFLNHTTLHQSSVYYQEKEDDGLIDLGLSLRALQPEAYHPSVHDDYGGLIEWSELNPEPRQGRIAYPGSMRQQLDCEDHHHDKGEAGAQSQERWAYVKVNMDGVIVGRKICILQHMGYSSLALQLEDMFGQQCLSGLRLFQAGSEFSLFYKDRDENWRTVGDVPWKEFVDRVKRLRIARKNEALSFPS